MEYLPSLLIIGCSIWVYFDAKSIGAERSQKQGFLNMGPVGWALSCLILWIVAFPLYLYQRPKIKMATGIELTDSGDLDAIQQSGMNRASKFIAIGWTIFCAVGVIYGLFAIGETASDYSGNSYAEAGMVIGTTIGMGFWFFIWLGATVPATIVYFITKRTAPTVLVEPASISNEATKKCPFCAETIKEEAILCRYCHKELHPIPTKRIETAPEDGQEDKPEETDQQRWWSQAKEYYRREEYKEAIAAYDRAVKISPEGQLFYERAAVFSKIKNKKQMQTDLVAASNMGHTKAKEMLSKIKKVSI